MSKWINPELPTAMLRSIQTSARYVVFLDQAPVDGVIPKTTIIGYGRIDWDRPITRMPDGAVLLRVAVTKPENYESKWEVPEPTSHLRAFRSGDVSHVAVVFDPNPSSDAVTDTLYVTTCPTVRVAAGSRLAMAPFEITVDRPL